MLDNLFCAESEGFEPPELTWNIFFIIIWRMFLMSFSVTFVGITIP